ncbi:MAG: TadG family pilus assembly protein [Methylocella sp.]
MNTKWNSLIYRMRTDRKGVVAIVVGLGLSAVAGMVGLVAQETIIYRTQSALQSSANIAALAGAQSINNPSGTAIATATTYSAVAGSDNTLSGQTVTMVSGYPQLKCLTSTGVACAGTDAANAIVVKQQATVPLIFGKLFGKSTLTLTATATAGGSGGGGNGFAARDIMLIVDTTQSMNNSDSKCSVSGATRVTCAEAGARTLLLGNPPANYGLTPSTVHVGLMVFPGLTTASQAAYDYDCATSPVPAVAKYNASPAPTYQIIPLSSDYKTSDTATSLNTSSNLVRAFGGGSSGCTQALDAVGGVNTYYAGVITAAQSALTTTGRTGVQKVIILLSDGDSNAVSPNVSAAQGTNECHQAITNAATATAAGTWVYTLAYGSATSSSCSTDSRRSPPARQCSKSLPLRKCSFPTTRTGAPRPATHQTPIWSRSFKLLRCHCRLRDCFPIVRPDESALGRGSQLRPRALRLALGRCQSGPRAKYFLYPGPAIGFSKPDLGCGFVNRAPRL